MVTGMANQQEQDAFKLLNEFKRLRLNGVNRDEAWYMVVDNAGGLTELTQKAFLNLAKDWERRVGYQYHYRDPQDTEATISRRDLVTEVQVGSQPNAAPQLPKNVHQGPPPQVAPPVRKQPKEMLTGALDPARLIEQDQQKLEQILDQLDAMEQDEPAASELPLPPEYQQQARPASRPPQQAPAQTQPQARPASRNGNDTAQMQYPDDFFGPDTALLLFFANRREPARVTVPGDAEFCIGRSTPNAVMSPEIDLNHVDGADFGVSRMHAAITRRKNQLLITDLGSRNHTRINGVRLMPEEVRVIKDGDEVWFGRLYCKIRFQQG